MFNDFDFNFEEDLTANDFGNEGQNWLTDGSGHEGWAGESGTIFYQEDFGVDINIITEWTEVKQGTASRTTTAGIMTLDHGATTNYIWETNTSFSVNIPDDKLIKIKFRAQYVTQNSDITLGLSEGAGGPVTPKFIGFQKVGAANTNWIGRIFDGADNHDTSAFAVTASSYHTFEIKIDADRITFYVDYIDKGHLDNLTSTGNLNVYIQCGPSEHALGIDYIKLFKIALPT
jgi:hypothetical protein